jgi:tRNA threonylcarbamoyladenosine biosynthesis protein TsaB
MAKVLFLDTSLYLALGIFDLSGNKWLEYSVIEQEKNATLLHKLVYSLLTKHDLSIDEISKFIFCSGPGSYTGMRLSEGFAQILEWQNKSVSSFYHFEVPSLLGDLNYYWYCNAFKNEYFCYVKSTDQTFLFKQSDLNKFLSDNQLIKSNAFTHYLAEAPVELTSNLIRENFGILVDKIEALELRQNVYYFRRAETEFKVTQFEE